PAHHRSTPLHLRTSSLYLSFHHLPSFFYSFFFFNDTATTEIYTLSLHDALPIYRPTPCVFKPSTKPGPAEMPTMAMKMFRPTERSEEHTSELQSRRDLVCRLLLEKKKKKIEIKQEIEMQRPRSKFNVNYIIVNQS